MVQKKVEFEGVGPIWRDPRRNSVQKAVPGVPYGGMATHLVTKRCDLGSLGVPGPASTPRLDPGWIQAGSSLDPAWIQAGSRPKWVQMGQFGVSDRQSGAKFAQESNGMSPGAQNCHKMYKNPENFHGLKIFCQPLPRCIAAPNGHFLIF